MKPSVLGFEVKRKQEKGSGQGKQQLLLDQVFSVNPLSILFMIKQVNVQASDTFVPVTFCQQDATLWPWPLPTKLEPWVL